MQQPRLRPGTKLVLSILLIAVAAITAWIGQLGLDWLLQQWPNHKEAIERFGGWLVGLGVLLVAGVPFLRLHGIIESKSSE